MIRIGTVANTARLPAPTWRAALARLPPVLQGELFAYRRWQDAQASLYGKLLLRRLFRETHGINLDFRKLVRDSYRRPHLIGVSDVDFNISHTAGLVVCAYAGDGRLGIDVERHGPVDLTEFRRVFTDREYRYLSGQTDLERAFFRLWTKKEAVMKADGRGFQLDPRTIDALSDTVRIESATYHLQSFDVGPLHTAHLATLRLVRVAQHEYRVYDLLDQS